MVANIDFVGKWPISGKEARAKKQLVPINPEKHLHLIHGNKNHILISLMVSNDYINYGIGKISIASYSDPEEHQGDEVLYVLEGTLVVRTFEANENMDSVSKVSYEICKGEKFLIPGKVKHQYFNFNDKLIKFLFGVSGKI
ncbi:MAG: hypothetical protein AABY84_12345 [Candidatus Firestonebacteria bacterium]